jgi:TonB family protein
MRPGSLAASFGLHVFMGLILFWVGIQGQKISKALPEATVVKLVRPKALSLPKAVPTKEKNVGVPKTAPPLEIPKPKVENNKSEPKKEPLTEKIPRATEQAPKELIGQAGTLSVQTSGFEYDFYLALVQAKIEQNFRPPPGGRGQQMSTVAFRITSNGMIGDVKLIQPSGNLLVDQSAERAIRSAGRFPPLPAQYEKGELEIHFEFVVNPKKGG